MDGARAPGVLRAGVQRGQQVNDFWKGVVFFGAPVALVSVASSVGPSPDWAMLWFFALPLLLVPLVGAIVLHVRKRTDMGNGALTAAGLGMVILFGTCVANLSRLNY
jgi:hypothetical protein